MGYISNITVGEQQKAAKAESMLRFLKTVLSERLLRSSHSLINRPMLSRREYQYLLDRSPTYTAGGFREKIILKDKLNDGGTNAVYTARICTLDSRGTLLSEPRGIVMKLCNPYVPRGRERHHRRNRVQSAFMDEIRINNLVRATNIEGVVQTYGGGRAGDIPYLKMEFILGKALDETFRTGLGAEEVAERLAQLAYLANTISQLHYYQVIHKDLKPRNLILCEDEKHKNNHKILLLDFGYANSKLRDSVTEYGGQLSPCYNAPEQALVSEGLTEAVDYFSFGVIMHEFLTGKNLFPSALDIFVNDNYNITENYLENMRSGRQNIFTANDEVRNFIDKLTIFDSRIRSQQMPNLFEIAHTLRRISTEMGHRDVNTDFLSNQLREYESH